jgi:hypothetical protein
MAERAHITSVETIKLFRANLIVYLSKARPTLEEIGSDVQRTKQWLQNDQRLLWQNELKVRRKKYERAQAELFSANISNFQEVSSAQQMAVRRCQSQMGDAEEKIKVLERWDRDLENRAEPMAKQIEQMHGFMTTEMPRAVAYLDRIIQSLEAYAEVAAPASSAPVAPPPTDSGNSTEPGTT